MPLNNSHFDSLFAMTALLNDTELEALANKCQQLIANREQIKRNQLRQELMENLQKAIDDILHNNFTLAIENTDRDCHDDYGCVVFDPDETYSITIR
jgi:biotin-(acetyl-CoA carboxylase) ligase